MITKNDCLSILVKLGDQGIENVNAYIKKLLIAKEVPIEVLKFISTNRGIEVADFYEMLRRSHNKHKSPLYVNIVKDDISDNEVITTLSSLLVQIGLYSRKITNVEDFFKQVRAEEITRVLNEFFKSLDFTDCRKLLAVIKADLLVLEYIAGRRELIK